MEKFYKVKSSAQRAAKKEFGDTWAESVEIYSVGEEFGYRMKNKADIEAQISPAPAHHEPVAAEITPPPVPDVPAFLKIESLPIPPVANPHAASNALIAQFVAEGGLQQTVSAAAQDELHEAQLADFQKQGDAIANEQAVDNHPLNASKCPKCGTTEIYAGTINEKTGLIVDEDKIIGCHHCDWYYDSRKQQVVLVKSTCKLPTKKVWHIADAMYDAAKAAGQPMPSRAEVQAECVKQGVASGTARTQFQHWYKQRKDSAAAPIATIGPDGKVRMPAK